jgi:hypothetical protein
MKRLTLLSTIIFFSLSGFSQSTKTDTDTSYSVNMKDVYVRAKWKNDTARYQYNQMRYYVTTVLPYVNAATALFKEIKAKSDDDNISRRERRQFINNKEAEVKKQFEDKIDALNTTQGVLLVKLIARQTELNIYKILYEFKNPLVAVKWQAWARLHGLNLDKKYRPEDENYLELIMADLGYPLPAGYAMSE